MIACSHFSLTVIPVTDMCAPMISRAFSVTIFSVSSNDSAEFIAREASANP